MRTRISLVTAGMTLAAVFALWADEPGQGKKTDEARKIRDDLVLQEQVLGRQFAEFKQSLLKLQQRLRSSPKAVKAQSQHKSFKELISRIGRRSQPNGTELCR